MKKVIALSALLVAFKLSAATNNLYYDDFSTDANTSRWSNTAGSWSITDGMLRGTVPDGFSYMYLDSSYSNYTVEARVRFNTLGYCAGIGVRLNSTNGANYSMCIYGDSIDGRITLEKYSNWDTWEVLDTKYFASVGTEWHTIRVEATNSNIKTYLDGTLVANVTDTSLSEGRPFVTVYTHANQAYFFDVDTFSVFSYIPSSPPPKKTKVLLNWSPEINSTYDIFTTTNFLNWAFLTNTVTNSANFDINAPMMFFKVIAKQNEPSNDAGEVTLAWNYNVDPNLTSYRVYCGTHTGSYSQSLDTMSNPFTVQNLIRGVQYYFTVTAVVGEVLESDYATEISYTPPLTSTNTVSFPVRNLKIASY
jgi:hypothetical protein